MGAWASRKGRRTRRLFIFKSHKGFIDRVLFVFEYFPLFLSLSLFLSLIQLDVFVNVLDELGGSEKTH